MLAQQKASNDSFEDEFNKPVESIMRCEDFKSNFARKLSNRYISWSPAVNSKRDPALKLCQTDNQDSPNIVPERIEQCSQLSTTSNLVQNGEVVKPPDKTIFKKSDIRRTEVNALNMEVDTLRWQLAQVNWRSYVVGNKVIMSHVSERFHEGYPGTLMAQVAFEVTCENTLKIEMKCTTSEPTIVNLSNASYFNLAGHHAGCETMYDHIFTINADKYTAVDDEGLVTGEKKIVGGTAYDFRVPRVLRTMLPRIPLGGYDINFCVSQGTEQDLTFQSRVLHPGSGRVLEVYSSQPGMQFYTGNLLPDPDKIVEDAEVVGEEHKSESEASSKSSANGEEANEEESEGKKSFGYVPLMGKQGTHYKKHGLFCLMPQNYPDAVNNKNFPNSVLNPGEVYVHRIQYKFGILLGKYI
ncbi:galactose mutarotase-like isoform X2 [Zerene cesonia]|uniref:galactose mutarotase-like isoform X2 n=1 Tax=Zerene cesonia TaxID=33412 RepID=UPI0018E50105|nr:galactose mutarotase-like isoform X2 [Zerene cesonia]